MVRKVLVLAIGLVMGFMQAAGPEAAALFKEAAALRAKGDLPGALARFRRAAKLDPALPRVHREIGLILLEQRDFSGAAGEFRSELQSDAADFQSRYNLALALANAGQLPESRKQIRLLLRQKPRWAPAYYGLGHIEALAGNREQAVQALRTALVLEPGSYRASFELGKLLADGGDREGAIEAFQNAVRVQPESAAARYRLGLLLQQTSRRESASHEFAAARELRDKRANGEQAAVAYRNGIQRLEFGDYAGAVAELERAGNLRPDFVEIRSALAQVHEQWGAGLESRGDSGSALAHYRSAVALEASPESLNHIGVLEARIGQLDAAIESFRAALRLDAEFTNADQNLRQALSLKAGQ